jgi:hypothetical protein
MERGDISNEVSPRLVIVWENLLGLLPTKAHEAKVSTYLKFKRYGRAVNVFELNEMLARRIWDVTWRLKFSVDVVTYVNDDFADEVRDRLDREDLPVGHVWHKTPQVLARELAYMPHVAAIYDPNPSHRFTYGSKGRIISPQNPDLIGQF